MNNKKTKLTYLLSASLILGLFPSFGTVAQANYSNLKQQQNEINKQSEQVSGKIDQTENEMSDLKSQKSELNDEIKKIQGDIDELVKNIAAHQSEIAALDKQTDQLNEKIDQLKEKIAKRDVIIKEQARSVQVQGTAGNLIDIILASEDISDLIGRIEVVSTLIGSNFDILDDQKKDQKTVEKSLAKIKENKKQQQALKEKLEVEKNNILAQQVEFDYKLEEVAEQLDLKADEREKFLAENSALASESSRLDGEMQDLRNQIAAEQRAARQEQLAAAKEAQIDEKPQASTSSNSGNHTTVSRPSNSGGFIRPASGIVSNPFGPDSFYASGFHKGMDIAGSGAIVAAKAGTVTSAGYMGDYGYCVMINHGGGVVTLYGHMQPGLSVYPGQAVSQGQQLGIMGSTGMSTGVHLHFEVRINGQAVNPAGYI